MNRFDIGLLVLAGRLPPEFHTGAVEVAPVGFKRWGWFAGAVAALGAVAVVAKGLGLDVERKVTKLTSEAEELERAGDYAAAQSKRTQATDLVRMAKSSEERTARERESGRESADRQIGELIRQAEAAEQAAQEAAAVGLTKSVPRFQAQAQAARQKAVEVAYDTYFLNQGQRARVNELLRQAEAAEAANQPTDARRLRARAEAERRAPTSEGGPLVAAAKSAGHAKSDEAAQDAAQEALLILMDPCVCQSAQVKGDRYGKYLLQFAAARASQRANKPLLGGGRFRSCDIVTETERGEGAGMVPGVGEAISPSMQVEAGWESVSETDPCTHLLCREEPKLSKAIEELASAAGVTDEEQVALQVGFPCYNEQGEVEGRWTEKMVADALAHEYQAQSAAAAASGDRAAAVEFAQRAEAFLGGGSGRKGVMRVQRLKQEAQRKMDTCREQMATEKKRAVAIQLTQKRLLDPAEVLRREQMRMALPAARRVRRTVEDPLRQLEELGACRVTDAERKAQLIREAAIIERAEACDRLRGAALQKRLGQITTNEVVALARLRRSA